MEVKVLDKLYKIVSEFQGQTLENVAFLKKTVHGKEILTAELTFKDQADVSRIMVFALDQELTEGDHVEMVEKLLQ
jgi:hypothetical protein